MFHTLHYTVDAFFSILNYDLHYTLVVMTQPLRATLTYYGISPWEIEVFYGLLNSHFVVVQDEVRPFDPDFVSHIDLEIPLDFNDAFFKWFDFKRWDRVKDILKEMKRRRGTGNALRALVHFSGTMRTTFVIDALEKRWFDNALEKIDFVLELLPHHLAAIPPRTVSITYGFNTTSARWRIDKSVDAAGNAFVFRGDGWEPAKQE